jgi:hypothetical protein
MERLPLSTAHVEAVSKSSITRSIHLYMGSNLAPPNKPEKGADCVWVRSVGRQAPRLRHVVVWIEEAWW